MAKGLAAAPATATATATATYVYCVLRRASRPKAGVLGKGLPHAAPPRALAVEDGLWLVVADAPLDRYGEGPIERGLRDLAWVGECAVGHEAVIEAAARLGTVLPLKLFTLFASDERAVEHVAKSRARITRALDRVTGCAEWGVRVSFDEARALRTARQRAFREAGERPSGTGFLLLKQKQREAERVLQTQARDEVEKLFTTLGGQARDALKRPPVAVAGATSRLLLDAAFLVPTRRALRFQAATRGAAQRLADDGYDVVLTGPWPPYHFAT